MYGGHAYAIGLGNLSHALAFNDTGINAKPLRFGQSVQRVPQIAETLHALQQLLRGRLGKAGRVFDPIIAIEGILRFVDATQAREMTLFLMYWQISRPMPDLPGGGATLFLAGEDHAYYEKAK